VWYYALIAIDMLIGWKRMEQTKICTKCKRDLSLSLFRIDKRLKSGFGSKCRECSNRQTRDWQEQNQEKRKESYKNWATKNKATLSQKKMQWAKQNPEKKKLADKKSREKNKDHAKLVQKNYRERNKERLKVINAKWRMDNHSYILSKNRERYALKKNRLPHWVTDEEKKQISELYAECNIRRENGENVHVDHIVPLKGSTVSGFHVLSNLRIISAKENLEKNNNFSDW
jgi:hypothetical protein